MTEAKLSALGDFERSGAFGQLTVYLRLLDVPIPPIYGPTADERGF